MSKGPASGVAPRERARDADDIIELFRIREPLDGRFPKDSLCPLFTRRPAATEPSSTGLDLARMLSFFQANIACQRGQVLAARDLPLDFHPSSSTNLAPHLKRA